MKILVTGAKGFIGKNLITELHNRGYWDIFQFDIDTDKKLLPEYIKACDFVFHLAGVNRPRDDKEFMEGNFNFTSELLRLMEINKANMPILFTSSVQVERDNPYGRSKQAGEELLLEYSRNTGAKVLIYRLPNVFGKWCRPNYNSVIATFCSNIAADLPIRVDNSSALINLAYIDDVINEFINGLHGRGNRTGDFCSVLPVYSVTLGKIVELLEGFKKSRVELSVPNMSDEFEKKLYSTYLSYLPEDSFKYKLNMHLDDRGSFTEFIKTPERGQFSVNISRPGITKGNHWHQTKNEKFLVVKGRGLIQFRKVGTSRIKEYHVSGDNLEVVDIPSGYIHSIINQGDEEMVTIMWANETFDPLNPDTFMEQVISNDFSL